MPAICLLLALLAGPFWEAKAPQRWTDAELRELLHDSPWAQIVSTPAPAVQVYLASALPMREAEAELAHRNEDKSAQGPDGEYLDFLHDDRDRHIVLAVADPDAAAFSDRKDTKRMQERCYLRASHKKYRMDGYFPPTKRDPYLRIVFPRAVGPNDKFIRFDLYLPGIVNPYRQLEFRIEDLRFRGKLEM